jgi:hypothetical protein
LPSRSPHLRIGARYNSKKLHFEISVKCLIFWTPYQPISKKKIFEPIKWFFKLKISFSQRKTWNKEKRLYYFSLRITFYICCRLPPVENPKNPKIGPPLVHNFHGHAICRVKFCSLQNIGFMGIKRDRILRRFQKYELKLVKKCI